MSIWYGIWKLPLLWGCWGVLVGTSANPSDTCSGVATSQNGSEIPRHTAANAMLHKYLINWVNLSILQSFNKYPSNHNQPKSVHAILQDFSAPHPNFGGLLKIGKPKLSFQVMPFLCHAYIIWIITPFFLPFFILVEEIEPFPPSDICHAHQGRWCFHRCITAPCHVHAGLHQSAPNVGVSETLSSWG